MQFPDMPNALTHDDIHKYALEMAKEARGLSGMKYLSRERYFIVAYIGGYPVSMTSHIALSMRQRGEHSQPKLRASWGCRAKRTGVLKIPGSQIQR